MIDNDELVQLKPKQIIYNNIYYYVKFICYKDYYYIRLYRKKILLQHDIIYYNSSIGNIEETDIIQNYEMVFEHELNRIIDELCKNNVEIRYSPNFIQNIIERFFKIYLKETLDNKKQEKLLQITNYENWDGMIKYE